MKSPSCGENRDRLSIARMCPRVVASRQPQAEARRPGAVKTSIWEVGIDVSDVSFDLALLILGLSVYLEGAPPFDWPYPYSLYMLQD
jgi:hypothetical protein